jgi:hypothetical protein
MQKAFITPKNSETVGREKRKWQLALRRYIVDKHICSFYAPYFGLDIKTIRQWIELQFAEGLTWENFGASWQFDHIVPIVYFDFGSEDDMRLGWNFTNIRVEPTHINKFKSNRIDVIGVRKYFEDLYVRTGYKYCKLMLDKIATLEIQNIESNHAIESFIIDNKSWLEKIPELTTAEFSLYNAGMSVEDIFLQRDILKKFGS